MADGRFRFESFVLDAGDRRLSRGDAPVELNARYLDALALLVREQGRLVTKDRFLDEVWRGVPVTDEALTQCIKTLRRQLGDDAGRPRFIETVPKHGYRFIAPVEDEAAAAAAPSAAPAVAESGTTSASYFWRDLVLLGAAGTLGGGVAGFFGGLFYGFAAAAQPLQAGMGEASVVLVLLCLTIAVALVGAAGVSFGIAAAGFGSGRPSPWIIAGGALGGLVVGALVKLLGLDAFNLLFGHAPSDMTGAPEGALIGASVGLGAWLASRGARAMPLRRSMAGAAVAGGLAGIAIALLGGRMMAGSLDLLSREFADSRLRLDPIGGWLGESGLGPISRIVTGGLEGALFGACVVGAMILARRTVTPGSG